MRQKKLITGIAIIILVFAGMYVVAKNMTFFQEEDDRKTVLTTFTVLADMTSEIAGDKINVVSLTKPGVEIHDYEPTPGDLVRASRADMIFENGMGLELWTSKLYASIPNVPFVTISNGVDIIPIAEGEYENKPNPHAWMSPKQALIYIENIRRALTELEPEHAGYFFDRAEDYSLRLMSLDQRLSESLAELPESQRYLVTCEGAFSYLTSDYGLQELYLWPINDETQGTPQQVARVIDEVKRNNIPAVFCESTIESHIQDEVVRATGARFGGTLYVDSLSAADGPAPTYIRLLEHTVTTIVRGLLGIE